MRKNIFKNLRPFGRKEELMMKSDSAALIKQLILTEPQYWEAIEDVIYAMQNRAARKMVVAKKEDMPEYAGGIKELNSLLVECNNMAKGQVKDNLEEIVKDQILPTYKNKSSEGSKKYDKIKLKSKEPKDIMTYLMNFISSKDMSKDSEVNEKYKKSA